MLPFNVTLKHFRLFPTVCVRSPHHKSHSGTNV